MRRTLIATLVLASTSALAQTTSAPSGDVGSAAAAFQEGQRAQLARDFARAAEFFELADHAAPSAAALRSAIRSHQAAGHSARAATLALVASTRDAADPQSTQLAQSVLAEMGPRLARVTVNCTPACTVTADQHVVTDTAAPTSSFYLLPGERTLNARWAGRGERSRTLSCTAGQSVELALDAPPPEAQSATPVIAPPPSVVEAPRPRPDLPPPEAAHSSRPVSPAVFWAGLAVTAVSAGVLVWSGVDTLSARDAYVLNATESGYNNGTSLELRTNVLVGTTAALGVGTAVLGAFFTNWSGSRRGQAMVPVLRVAEGRTDVGLGGAF